MAASAVTSPERVRLAAPILGFAGTVSLLAGIVFEERLTWGIASIALLTAIVFAGFFLVDHLDDESRKMYAKTRPVALLGMAFLLALLAAAVSGRADAKGKDTFLVLTNKPSFVVVKVYGDRAISKRLDTMRRCLTDDIEVFTFSNRSVRFIQKDLGRLSQC